jgi:hypothetical protein
LLGFYCCARPQSMPGQWWAVTSDRRGDGMKPDGAVEFHRGEGMTVVCLVFAALSLVNFAVQMFTKQTDYSTWGVLTCIVLLVCVAVLWHRPYARVTQEGLTLRPKPGWKGRVIPWSSVETARFINATQVELSLVGGEKTKADLLQVRGSQQQAFIDSLEERLGPLR